MPTIQHSVLSGSEIHEPKGVDTASANQVYVADGAGSGNWADTSANSIVLVEQASDLGGTLDSSKVYLVDGVIDMGSTVITVPSGGLTIGGLGIEASGLTSTSSGYTMFVGGGNLLMNDMYLDVSGTGSQVFNLTGVSNFEAIEFTRVNFNNCTSLGEVSGYRQGLEDGTGRFGGTPNLTLSGTWSGGYAIRTSIVRILAAGMTGALFEEGTGFTMASRFFCDANVDLPASAAFCDFQASNFTGDSLYQLRGMLLTRNGVKDASDTNITPNLGYTELEASFRDNQGIPNTHEGGELCISASATTTINTLGVYEDIVATTWVEADLEHFDQPSAGQLRHLGSDPREYWVTGTFSLEGTANEDIAIRLNIWDNSASAFVPSTAKPGQVGNFTGGRDVVQIHLNEPIILDENDYVKVEVVNNTSTNNITAEVGSCFAVQRRA